MNSHDYAILKRIEYEEALRAVERAKEDANRALKACMEAEYFATSGTGMGYMLSMVPLGPFPSEHHAFHFAATIQERLPTTMAIVVSDTAPRYGVRVQLREDSP